MSDNVCREKYWEEKTDSEKVMKLGEIVESFGRRIIELENTISLLHQHAHVDGKLLVPMVHNQEETPYYFKHVLGREPR